MTYIHEKAEWRTVTWDVDRLLHRLSEVRYRQGELFGQMKALGFTLRNEASLQTLTNDVVKSSAIEGESLNPDEVRSSVARRLGIETAGMVPSGRDVDGVVEMMLDATQNYDSVLTKERLFTWHASLFPTGRSGMHEITVGAWRTDENGPMQVISGPVGKEKVHFEAPAAERVDQEMDTFLLWFNSKEVSDPLLKAARAHFWFVTIHPFEDGNGRIARAIADMALAQADNSQHRFYSMSSQIESERQNYYDQLERQQRSSLDITPWLIWFIDCMDRALENAHDALTAVIFKAKFWEKVNQQPVSERQQKVLNRMLSNFEGHMNTSRYASLEKCSKDTALRDLQALEKRNILIKNPGGGRSTSYRLPIEEELRQIN